MTTQERADLCRRIASQGGRATVEKHGAAHMADLGRRGFDGLVQRLGDRGQAVNFLRDRGVLPVVPFARPNWERGPEGAPVGRITYAGE